MDSEPRATRIDQRNRPEGQVQASSHNAITELPTNVRLMGTPPNTRRRPAACMPPNSDVNPGRRHWAAAAFVGTLLWPVGPRLRHAEFSATRRYMPPARIHTQNRRLDSFSESKARALPNNPRVDIAMCRRRVNGVREGIRSRCSRPLRRRTPSWGGRRGNTTCRTPCASAWYESAFRPGGSTAGYERGVRSRLWCAS